MSVTRLAEIKCFSGSEPAPILKHPARSLARGAGAAPAQARARRHGAGGDQLAAQAGILSAGIGRAIP